MKFGIRKPSFKKSLKARTTGKLKRSAKRALIPGYGKKGMGWIKNPKKAAYNKAYNKTSVSLFPAIPSFGKTNRKNTSKEKTKTMKVCKFCDTENQDSAKVCSSCGANEFIQKTYNTGMQNIKQRKTWLWVLGWMFIFPVPLTILMVRNKKLNKIAKIAIITIAWMLYLIIACAGGTDDTETKTAETDNNVSSVVSSENVENVEESKTVLAKESSSVDSSGKVKSDSSASVTNSSSSSVTSSKKTETTPESKVSSSKQQSAQKTATSTPSSSSSTSKPATSSKSSSSSTSSKKTSSSSSSSNTSSKKTSSSTSSKASSEDEVDFSQYKYVININSGKVHKSTCRYVKQISKGNAEGSNESSDTLSKHYNPCGVCKPFKKNP